MKNITVKEFMSPYPILIDPDATLLQAAQKMKEIDCGFLPVGKENKLVGIITDRDIVIRAISAGRDPSREKVSDYMTPHVYACNEKDFIEDAADKMHEHKVTRLVVKNRQGRVTGVLSFGAILRQDTTSSEVSQIVKHALYPDIV